MFDMQHGQGVLDLNSFSSNVNYNVCFKLILQKNYSMSLSLPSSDVDKCNHSPDAALSRINTAIYGCMKSNTF